ncbi:pyruvate dehydrogenase (acetyl-transferring) E1 component subunit alpha [Halorussus salilacus]|uniref:pyruvate dehydrogenase (acetyl-transferring) E1 component subunit alpha n=1 Tax=Halorussus salilacus TaxID=2953750 RepID=UPI0020A03615|nr:pyruvate dehydrogenase (acetyl-transferring) E1 component subunit alpha [Halorussus salilacus]USZ68747.1 pyruvate dehydrogenase (acetyl-transferring) E1 component subunit alpha [Halorussus salilacus]
MAIQAPDVNRVLAPDGTVDERADPDLSASAVVDLYRLQVFARTFDEKAVTLHRQGRIGTYAPLQGQEAAQVGAAYALAEDDYCFPTYRDHAMYLARGLPLEDVLVYLLGEGNYVDRQDPEGLRTFPPTIPIATQLPHAVGTGMAADYRGDDCATLVSFGDGATSEGDFHEGMNFAGVFDAPTVFFCQNNQWAISVPRERQTASATIAQKARAYGFEGVRVDGNDVLAVYAAVSDALDAARAGEGPRLIEAVTYRQGAHTTTDDPSKYRDDEEVAEWVERDPVERTREYLEDAHGWTDDDERELREWADERVAEAVATAEDATGLGVEDIFEQVYAETPRKLRRQREQVVDDPEVDR